MLLLKISQLYNISLRKETFRRQQSQDKRNSKDMLREIQNHLTFISKDQRWRPLPAKTIFTSSQLSSRVRKCRLQSKSLKDYVLVRVCLCWFLILAIFFFRKLFFILKRVILRYRKDMCLWLHFLKPSMCHFMLSHKNTLWFEFERDEAQIEPV